MKPYTVTFLWLKFSFPTISISLSGIYLRAFIRPQKKCPMYISRLRVIVKFCCCYGKVQTMINFSKIFAKENIIVSVRGL